MNSLTDSPTIFELRRRSGSPIFAVPYLEGRRLRIRQMPDGAIVESPTPSQYRRVPKSIDACLGLAQGGEPASMNHYNLGLVTSFLPLEGLFLLPDGEVAAIYGAEAVVIGA